MGHSDEAYAQGLRYVQDRLAEGRATEEIVDSLVVGGWSEADARALIARASRQSKSASWAAPPPPTTTYGVPRTAADTTPNPLATAALVVALVGIIVMPLAPLAVVLGIFALSRPGGRNAATGGLVIGGLMTAALLLIAPLAAVTFPVFGRARDKAMTASCQSNLKQLALATLMYAQDYDERLPGMRAWPKSLYPYVKNQAIFACPADRSPKRVAGMSWSEGKGLSYAGSASLSHRSLAEIVYPATTPALFDSNAVPTNEPQGAAFRHMRNTMADFAFVDGHVRSMNRSGLLTLRRQYGPARPKPARRAPPPRVRPLPRSPSMGVPSSGSS